MTAVVGFLLFVAGFVVRDYLHEREQRATPVVMPPKAQSETDVVQHLQEDYRRWMRERKMPGPIVDAESERRWKEWEVAVEREYETGIIPKPGDTLQQLTDAYMAVCLLEECGLKGQVDV